MSPGSARYREIAYYCVATHLGGAERSLLDLVTRVGEHTRGWYRPWLILPKADGPLVDAVRAAGLSHTVLPMPSALLSLSRARPLRALVVSAVAWPMLRAYLARLRRLLDERQPALLHTTGIKCHVLSTRLGRRTPLLWHLRDIMPNDATRALLRRYAVHPFVHVLSNSYATANAFQPDAEHPSVVSNGIDTEVFTPGDGSAFRAEAGAPPGVPLIGALGVLQRGKGIDSFLQMAAEVLRGGLDARFAVVGDEIYDTGRDRGLRRELEDLAERLGLADRVHFAGFRRDSVQVLRGLDVLVSASTHPESFGRVLVEAMACGVPVAASAIGGSLEIVTDRDSGRLFPPGDVPAMARAVTELCTDPELRAGCIARGRERVLRLYDVERYVAGVVRAYDRVLQPTADSYTAS
ncbi:MAG: glycosyltransferase [Planctomycetes bacterium]|nr:glycosyltransferase [Planctomycetota bacterium]MCB9871771.1 glycosyltransferase [Planctomycetota bacterium]